MSEESKLQAQIVNYAKKRGLLVKRNYQAPGAERGWPDIEIFGPGGVVVLIEMKAPGKKASKIQEYRISRLRDLGHYAYVCDSFVFGKEIIDVIFPA
jgi:hypothetical protein